MADPNATTKLEAVNRILSAINEAKVASLGSGTSAHVQQAEDMLDEINKDVQSDGWEFNIEMNVELAVVAGKIPIPANAAWVHVPNTFNTSAAGGVGTSSPEGHARYTTRGGYLYDRVNRTDDGFTSSVKATVCYLLDFEKLPEVARKYIYRKAARKLADQVKPNPQRHSTMLRDELLAKSALTEQEGRQESFTIFDNFDAYQAIDRRNAATQGPHWA